MCSKKLYEYEAICALATPLAKSALAVIRTSGKDIIEIISGMFSRPHDLIQAKSREMLYGNLIDQSVASNARLIDEVMLSVFRNPQSYTGEDSIEIYCHGSIPVIEDILTSLRRKGVRAAEPGEFTQRAFLNGKMDLTQAEAIHEIVESKTQAAKSMALNRLSGSISQQIDTIKSQVLDLMAAVSVQLDYPDDEIEHIEIDSKKIRDIKAQIDAIAASYNTGRLYQEGLRIALVGKTNAGKSSLFNQFLKEDRAIVSEIHGTTRDYLEASVKINEIPIFLYDTAGLRETTESIEGEGIRRSKDIMERVDLVLYLVDSTQGLDENDVTQIKNLENAGQKLIKLWNKTDLDSEFNKPDGWIARSRMDTNQFLNLEAAIIAMVQDDLINSSSNVSAIIDSPRQRDLLLKASESLGYVLQSLEDQMPLDLLSVDVKDVLDALGEITGEVHSEDILDRIFSGFCLGK
jgi:tRNA modification GTPase